MTIIRSATARLAGSVFTLARGGAVVFGGIRYLIVNVEDREMGPAIVDDATPAAFQPVKGGVASN